MADVFIVQSNPSVFVDIVASPISVEADLFYTAGGGVIFGNTIKDDLVQGGKQVHEGNPILSDTETPIYKKCDKVTVVKETITVESANITRGLYIYRQLVSSPSDINDKSAGKYYWDEVYTTPIGFQTVIATNSGVQEFSINGNQIKLQTNDVNIIPKEGDYLILQKVNNTQYTSLPSDVIGVSASFTDGYSNMPVIFNTETYQLKITSVSFSSPSGTTTEYTLITDKSITVDVGDIYSLILLNRENTGLQKELFYDTFEQIEVHRDQLLGDPYFNNSTIKPLGRKNYLYYNNAQYLGLKNLLSGIINTRNQNLIETPFLVYDITEEIKDRFLPEASTSININFEFHLPTVLLQDDTTNKLNILTNYGTVQKEIDGVGRYSGLYLKWAPNTSKRYGFIFYDLRIVVIDDSELALALGYNSNRNYTLPRATISSVGNTTANLISNINLDVIALDNNSSGGAVVLIVNGKHNLETGTAVTILDVNVKIPGTNQIQAASVNGVKYIKRFYTDTINSLGERTDRFYVYDDLSLTTGTIGNGEFVNNGIGNSGKVRSSLLSYDYFFTYRNKNDRYSSILPYSEIRSFNFSTSLLETTVDNSNGSLFLTFPAFTYLNHIDGGFECSDFEIIIGKWEATNPSKPFEITGISDIVVISVNELPTPFLPSSTLPIDIVVPKSIYDSFVNEIGNGNGAYDYTTNSSGDPEYDIYNNLKHYTLTSGTLEETLNTAEGKWTLGNISYKTHVEQYRSKIQVIIGANEWNDTTNPSYNPENQFLKEKYISEVAICSSSSDKPLIYTKIAPPIKKTPDLDIILQLSVDF